MQQQPATSGDTTSSPSSVLLVEAIVVAMVLGIMAFSVGPRLSRASEQSHREQLATNLRYIRQAIELYHDQHNGQYPTLEQCIPQLTNATTLDGIPAEVGTAGHTFGPYLTYQRMINPFTGSATVGTGPVGSSDWYYNQATGEFRANHHPDYRDM